MSQVEPAPRREIAVDAFSVDDGSEALTVAQRQAEYQ
jgi:hypothetical protein